MDRALVSYQIFGTPYSSLIGSNARTTCSNIVPDKPLRRSGRRLVSTVGSSPLFRLPGEVRVMIYTLLLVSDTATKDPLVFANMAGYHSYESKLGNLPTHGLPPRSLHPAVLRTCRLVRFEARPILYRRNKFIFTNTRSAHAVRRYADQEMTPFLTHITLRLNVRLNAYQPRYGFRGRTFIADYPNLRKLKVIVVIPPPAGLYDPPSRIWEIERRQLRSLLWAMVNDLRGIKTVLVRHERVCNGQNGEIFRPLSALVEIYMGLMYKGNGHEEEKKVIWKAIEDHMHKSTQ